MLLISHVVLKILKPRPLVGWALGRSLTICYSWQLTMYSTNHKTNRRRTNRQCLWFLRMPLKTEAQMIRRMAFISFIAAQQEQHKNQQSLTEVDSVNTQIMTRLPNLWAHCRLFLSGISFQNIKQRAATWRPFSRFTVRQTDRIESKQKMARLPLVLEKLSWFWSSTLSVRFCLNNWEDGTPVEITKLSEPPVLTRSLSAINGRLGAITPCSF